MTIDLAAAKPKDPVLLQMFRSARDHRHLVALLIARYVEMSFRGSLLGKLWTALVPLFRLAVYTFVFGVILKVKWPGTVGSKFEVALLYFAGLTLFDFFVECLGTAPGLMLDNVNFIKKVVFPLEILPLALVGSALVRLAVTTAILLAFYLAIEGLPGPAILAIPLVLAPFALIVLGSVWFLSALGAFVRDMRQVMALATLVLMYLSPIFFPLAAAPPPLRPFLYANPLTFAIETVRAALFADSWPNWWALALYAAIAWLFATAGYLWFMRVKPGFADVV
jgi:lipopolysaccharide transport system permease protein